MFQKLVLPSLEPVLDLEVNFISREELLESQFLVLTVSYFVSYHADGSRVDIAVIRVCDSVCICLCVCVRTMKLKRLKVKSPNLAQR